MIAKHEFSPTYPLPDADSCFFARCISVRRSFQPESQSRFCIPSYGAHNPLHIELVTDENSDGHLVIPRDSVCDKVEILKYLTADTTELGSGRREIKQDLVLQSFDSGVYRLNPILYVEKGETIASNRLVLKVYPVVVDSLETIHDYADVADVDRSFIDYLPDFIVDYGLWILALIVVLALGGFAFYMMKKKKNPFAAPAPKPIPPYEKAIGELSRLRAEKLCEQGKEKEYYTRLTDILRIYLNGRFGINAMEMTSTQIRRMLNANEETRLSKETWNECLRRQTLLSSPKYARCLMTMSKRSILQCSLSKIQNLVLL